jgi:serine/threonine protein kinase
MAVTPVRALVLPVADFHRLARNEPSLAAVLSRLTARRLGEDTHDALSGKIFHGHTIRQRLGRGGMAVVYEADEAATGRRVALKMMSHRFIFREEAKQRFQREADLIESFDHENIAKMFGRFEAFHTFFIVMEFCDGASLDQILGGLGRLAIPDARRILGQLAAALDYAHGHRVVHRDLKPSNVMVNRDGVVKLMDFGLAQPLSESGPASRRIAGTPPYMAPEQLTGGPLGTATDVFALGGMAWELLTGTTPFQSVDFEGLRREHQAWALPPLVSILPGVDPDLVRFVEACLVREPERRLADLSEVASWAGHVDYKNLVS